MRACIVLLAACGIPTPTEVSSGRLSARFDAQPARLALALDGAEVWATSPGAFAEVDTAPAPEVDSALGSFRFASDAQVARRVVDELDDITETDTGATFTLVSGGDRVGTGTLTFDPSVKSGPDPAAAQHPRHVRIELAFDAGDRAALTSWLADDEHLAGLGGQSFDVDHRGRKAALWVQEDGLGKFGDADDDYSGSWQFQGRRHSTHSPMPMVLSSRGYAMVVDTTARCIFDLGAATPDAARFEAWDRHLDVQVFVGEDTPDALGHMVAWTGKPDHPPRTIFAPWVDAIFGSDNVRRVATHLRDAGVPASVIWTEDWRGGADEAAGGPGAPSAYALTEDWHVDRTKYPDFEQLAADLHAQGFAFLTYNNSFIDSTGDVFQQLAPFAIKDATGAPYTFQGVRDFAPATLLDLTNPAAVAAGQQIMGQGLALGADGWMADFGEWQPTDAVLASGEDALAVHNRYPVDWARYTHDLLAGKLYFMRSAWLHSQPLVQVMWPGDQQTDWTEGDGLPSVIPMGVGLGVTGFPYFGGDIAGYMSLYADCDAPPCYATGELFYRWTAFGAFQPVMRTHHGRSARDNYQWEHDSASVAHFRQWTRFHMQLVPYLAGLVASFDRDGLPLMRLVALEFPTDAFAWTTTDEYMLGDRILVAPVQVQHATSRAVQLPAGTWYPLLGGDPVAGAITAQANMTTIPVFVPEGTLLVLDPDGVDSLLPGAAHPETDDREVWLWPGTPASPTRAEWHDDLGTAGAPQWTWTGRAPHAVPQSATFDGAPVAIQPGAGFVTVELDGDGTLAFDGGGILTVARGEAAHVTVRLYTP